MPVYSYRCRDCGSEEISAPMTFTEYEEFESMDCSKCGAKITMADRDYGSDNTTKTVIGVTKGNYGSTDPS